MSERVSVREPSASSLADLAAAHGLSPSSVRPPLGRYLRQLVERRHFLIAFSRARVLSTYSKARLGQLWQVVTPLLHAGVYYLLFAVLLNTDRGIENFVGFLVVGVFIFGFTQRCVLRGADAINRNLGLIRALHFPRATLPLATTLAEFQHLAPALAVLTAVVLVTGEPLTARWLLVVPAVALQCLFNAGIALAVARVGAQVRDINQILPFAMRTWFYVSGVFFSLDRVLNRVPDAVDIVLQANPAAVYIDLVRAAVLSGHEPLPHSWPLAVGWAALAIVGGFLFFWRAEERYGRG